MSVRANPLANQPDFWATMVQAGAAISSQKGNGAFITRTGVGTYTVDLDVGGASSTNEGLTLSVDAAVGVFVRLADTSNNQKLITVTNSGNAAAELTALRIAIWRTK